ncbi:MAG: TetR/AcrR family transcriptional regulator [Acidimicrobiales bacterium]
MADMPLRLAAADRREQLLAVALSAFSEGEFSSVSMDEVARLAGVTKPVLYQHFRSKRSLYLELLKDVGNQLIEAVTKAASAAEGPRGEVEAGFAVFFRFAATKTSAFRLLFGGGSRRDPGFAAAISRVEDVMAEVLAPLIEADIAPPHRRALAYGLIGMAEATGRHWLDHGLARPSEPAGPGSGAATLEEADRVAAWVADLAWRGLRGITPDRAGPG